MDSVVRYERGGDGRLVPSVVPVKPASEEFRLPTGRAQYALARALETERQREALREEKLRGFLGRMKEIGESLGMGS